MENTKYQVKYFAYEPTKQYFLDSIQKLATGYKSMVLNRTNCIGQNK